MAAVAPPEEAALSEAPWSLIEPLLVPPPTEGPSGQAARRPPHRVLGGLLWVARTGCCSWRERPEEYGDDFTTA